MIRPAHGLLICLAAAGCAAPGVSGETRPMRHGTFTIVAYDPKTETLGVATQSKVLAVGAVVPWAQAGVGAVATQGLANPAYGPKGLSLLEQGKRPAEVVDALTSGDSGSAHRQLVVLDAEGRAAVHTGGETLPWAGHRVGETYAVAGNILAGAEVVEAMAETFERTDGPIGGRMIEALKAGQAAGGDRRGRQSAALLVVKEGGGPGGFNDRFRDLRVDDHDRPIEELERLYELHKERVAPERQRRTDGD